MLESFLYQDDNHPTHEEIMQFAIRAATSDLAESAFAPLVGKLLDAYQLALEWDEETMGDLNDNGGILSRDKAEAYYQKVYLQVNPVDEGGWWPESIPYDEFRDYPTEFIQTVAMVEAQRDKHRLEVLRQTHLKQQANQST